MPRCGVPLSLHRGTDRCSNQRRNDTVIWESNLAFVVVPIPANQRGPWHAVLSGTRQRRSTYRTEMSSTLPAINSNATDACTVFVGTARTSPYTTSVEYHRYCGIGVVYRMSHISLTSEQNLTQLFAKINQEKYIFNESSITIQNDHLQNAGAWD